jgi:hypothetical protein
VFDGTNVIVFIYALVNSDSVCVRVSVSVCMNVRKYVSFVCMHICMCVSVYMSVMRIRHGLGNKGFYICRFFNMGCY